MKPPRPDVVAKRPPCFSDIVFGRGSERFERGILAEPLVILRQDAIDLRLLQHHLRHEDVIRVARAAPREVPAVAAIPSKQRPPETLTGLRRRQGSSGHPLI